MARLDDYEESFRLAADELKRADLSYLAAKAGMEIPMSEGGEVRMRLAFLGSPFVIRVAERVEVGRAGSMDKASLPEQILICHYVLRAPEEPETGRLITFRQIPDGQFYFDAFRRRTRDPFLAAFGADKNLFKTCGETLGGKLIEGGDMAMAFQVFPRVAVQLILWTGDDEFPPEASILFDENMRHGLSAEDIAVMTGMLVYRLMGLARNVRAGTVRS
jgi:hypothetical protein